jgi:phosphohistidine phosphatase
MPDRTLILLRHGKSDWSDPDSDDLARPLARRGRRQAQEAGRWLAATMGSIDLAVVSPAVRTRATWDLASSALDVTPTVLVDDRVYAASDDELLTVVREIDDAAMTVVLVGHNPGVEDLALTLTGEAVPMPTSALAVVTVEGSWSTAGHRLGVLRHAGRPPTT